MQTVASAAPSAALRKTKPTLDLLTPIQIKDDYYIPVGTQDVWASTNRYGFRDLVIKVGRNRRINRADLERWLLARKLGPKAAQ